jgi:hypothetical protein
MGLTLQFEFFFQNLYNSNLFYRGYTYVHIHKVYLYVHLFDVLAMKLITAAIKYYRSFIVPYLPNLDINRIIYHFYVRSANFF